jgi:hypothetical protein
MNIVLLQYWSALLCGCTLSCNLEFCALHKCPEAQLERRPARGDEELKAKCAAARRTCTCGCTWYAPGQLSW